MSILDYVDLPKIPDFLLPSISEIIASPRQPSVVKYDLFQTRKVNDDLHDWLKHNMHMDFHPQFQLIYNGIPIHKDIARNSCYNYLLDTGGENVKTIVYDESKLRILKALHIPLKTWYYLNTTLFHTVKNIETVRIALSLSINIGSRLGNRTLPFQSI